MTLMESSQSDLFARPPAAAPAVASTVQQHEQHPDHEERALEEDWRREGVVHGAEIRGVQYGNAMQQEEEEGRADFATAGTVGTAAAAGEQGDDSAVLVGGDGLIIVGGEDDEVGPSQRVERFDYMPLVEEEGFQFGSVASVLGAGRDNGALATESEGGGLLCMQEGEEEEAWIAQGIDTSNYALGNEADSIFEAAIREIINKSSQAAGYVHVAEVVEEVGDLDDTQQLDTVPQASDSLLYTIEVGGVSGHEPFVGLPQDAGTSNFEVGGEDVAVSDQTIFAPKETGFIQAGEKDVVQAGSETSLSENAIYAAPQVTNFIHAAEDGSDSLPTVSEQDIYTSTPQDADFVLAFGEPSDSLRVASTPQQIADNVLVPLEQDGNSQYGYHSFSEKSKDDSTPLNGGKRKREEIVNGADVVDTGHKSEQKSNVGVNDQDESGTCAISPLSKEEFVSTSLPLLPIDVKPEPSSAGGDATMAEVPKGQSERTVKTHLGNGVRVSFDAKTYANAKGPDELSRDEKSGVDGPKEGAGVPLWVKWRGKWEAAIQCCITDCPSTTLKAKPNYSKKKHVVVYFPSARLFSWVDTQHTCPICEYPLPLLTGTHTSGREAVKDESLPRRRMLLKLGGEMLDISDRLHIKAVVESSQNVNVWKTFAREAAAATNYAELGILLVRLHLAIVAIYIKPGWMERRYGYWKEDCAKSASAASLQKLTKELINAVFWEEVAPLWNAPEQPELDPEWEHWKGEAFEEKDSEDDKDSKVAIRTALENGTPQGRQICAGSGSKRFKEQARAHRQTQLSPDMLESFQQKRSKVNSISSQLPGGQVSSSVGHATTAFRSPLVQLSPLWQGQQTLPPRVQHSDQCHEVVSGFALGGSSGDLALVKREAHIQGGPVSNVVFSLEGNQFNASNATDKKAEVSGGSVTCNSGLCSAFLKKKNRRCNRQAKEEITYCGKHKHLANPENAGKELALEGGLAWESGLCSACMGQESTRCVLPTSKGIFCRIHVYLATDQSADRKGEVVFTALSNEPRCSGITTRGVQCTHKPKDGSPFCVKHSTQGTNGQDNEENEIYNLLKWTEGCASKRARVIQTDLKNETGRSSVSPLLVQVGQAGNHSESPGALGNGLMQRSITTSTELKSVGNDGVPRKRKWVSSFFNQDSVQTAQPLFSQGQEAILPKVTEGRANSWTRCKGRTMRKDEQCSFRARAGHALCTKHLIAVDGQRKINAEDPKVSSSFSGAKHLLERYLKAAEGISPGAHGVVSKKQLLKWTRAEAAQNYYIADELLKLVNTEMSRIQTFLQPMEAAENKKDVLKSGLPVTGNGNVRLLNVPETVKAMEESTSVTCGLCDLAFVAKEDIGRHWQSCHRKEVPLFVKGYACRACTRLYSRKHTVRRHWKKRHQSLPVRSPDWTAVCSICDKRFEDHDGLLEHVCSEHPDNLMSPMLKNTTLLNRVGIPVVLEGAEILECADCHEEFHTHWDLFHHRERTHKCLEAEVYGGRVLSTEEAKLVDMHDVDSQSMPQIFGCHICGKKFSSLSDLGHHKEVEHFVGDRSATPRAGPTGKRVVNSESCRLKLPVRRKSDEKVGGPEQMLGGVRRSKKKGRFMKQSEKKSYEKDLEIEKEALLLRMKAAVQTAQLRNLRQLKRGEAPVARPRKALYSLTKGGQMLPFDGAPKYAKFPDDRELLGIARSVCCQSQLLAILHKKDMNLPDQLFAKVAQVCTEASVQLDWLANGYLCSSGCKELSMAKGNADHPIVCDPLMSVKADATESGEKDVDESGKPCLTSEHLDSKSKAVILSSDLSGGQEPVPVVCFVDQDVVNSWTMMHNNDGSSSSEVFRPWDTFNYITKRVLDPSLGLDPENYKVGCSCEEDQCLSKSCDHVDIFDNDNLDALDIRGKPMKGRFPYDEKGCIILEEGYLVYECNSSCHCQETCQNRVLQKGVTVKLEVFRTLQKGWAVRAAQMIPRGTFVCEYLGEVLHDQEANKRGERYDQVGCSYLYDIDAHLDTTGKVGRSKPFVIDATKHGNVARFINHSCAPNLVNYQVLVDSMDCQLAHIGLFASRDIERGEELAYDYRYRLLPGKGCPCHCGAQNCRGRLY